MTSLTWHVMDAPIVNAYSSNKLRAYCLLTSE